MRQSVTSISKCPLLYSFVPSSDGWDLAGDLKKVELILPPPARLDAGAVEGALPRSTQKALGRLLAACGLSAEFSGALADPSPLPLFLAQP